MMPFSGKVETTGLIPRREALNSDVIQSMGGSLFVWRRVVVIGTRRLRSS